MKKHVSVSADGGFPRLETWPLSRLKPADYNPRTITAEALGRLTKSIATLGNLQPITVNAATGRIIGGHQRLKCLLAMGQQETQVWLVELDEAREKAANLALNNLAGEFDDAGLRTVLTELAQGEIDMDVTGIDARQLTAALGHFGPDSTPADTGDLTETFEVVVECCDESAQRSVFEQLTKEGKKCRLHTF